jgi:hypothetical protein
MFGKKTTTLWYFYSISSRMHLPNITVWQIEMKSNLLFKEFYLTIADVQFLPIVKKDAKRMNSGEAVPQERFTDHNVGRALDKITVKKTTT